MAKVSLVQRDLKRRKLWNKYKEKRASLLAIANDKSSSAEERFEARLKLSKIPRNRFVMVEELASLVAWMASEENSFTTGAVFDLSGGRATY